MKEKWMSSVMAGVFISMGAMTYLAIPNTLVGSLFFAVGILLVLNLHNMLVTRVCPLMVYDRRYHWGDVAVAWAGNGIGTLIAAAAVQGTRFQETIREPLTRISETKLADSPLSLFILAVFCGFFVAFAVLIGARYEKGSFAQIFYVWLFITAFVFCGFEHIVADMFYLSCCWLQYGIDGLEALKVLALVTAGNLAGGMFIAWAVRSLDQKGDSAGTDRKYAGTGRK